MHVTIVGYGTIGRMHARLLRGFGARIGIVDPRPVDYPVGADVWGAIDEIPERTRDAIDVWVISNPTVHHLPTLRNILACQSAARVFMEKPACASHEIDGLRMLLSEHPRARLVVNQQYRHSRLVSLLRAEMARVSDRLPDSIEISFTKDRRADIAAGRFIDTDYEILGYEWTHMISVLEGLLPAEAVEDYLVAPVEDSRFVATRKPSGYVTGLREHSLLDSTHLSMHSTITEDLSGRGAPSRLRGHWQRSESSAARHRYAAVRFGDTLLTAEFDPVTTIDGYRLPRNKHRLIIESDGRVLDERIMFDSPLTTSLRSGLAQLAGSGMTTPWLPPVRRIANISRHLRTMPTGEWASSDNRAHPRASQGFPTMPRTADVA
jgi:predicted dehydrogenase